MAKTTHKLIIIDGNALIHRSFHALPDTMRTKTGELTNAVYGFTTVLIKALKEFKPEYVVLTLDRKEKTFRHKAYAEYKAKRVKAPDELYAQIPRVKEIAKVFNIPIFEKAGFEADDLIGTIARKANIECIILTGDMDALQLINDRVRVYTMSRGLSDSVLYDTRMVAQKFNGLTPVQIIDYKALRGDPSDNIIGVKGIGEKGAIDLIKEFGSIENLYDCLKRDDKKIRQKIKPRIVELLKNHEQDAFFSKQLATIKCDVDIDFDLEAAKTREFDSNKVMDLFNELEFKSLLVRLQELNKKLQPVNKTSDEEQIKFHAVEQKFKYQLINNYKDFQNFFTQLKKQKIFAYDTETANFNPLEAILLGISFSWKAGEAYYLQFKNEPSSPLEQSSLFAKPTPADNLSGLDIEDVLQYLKPVFADDKIKKICHNAKFDLEVVEAQKNADLKVRGLYFDTMIASYLLNPSSRQHSLDATTLNYLHYTKISKDDLLGKGRNKIKFYEVPVERLYLYSCEDADFTFRLYEKLMPILKKNKLDKLFFDIEMPLISVLTEMEQTGIKLDIKYLAQLQKNFARKITELTDKIHETAGQKFNINSTQQLQEILFERLNIPTHIVKRTKTGYSTAAEELAKLRGQHEIIDLISAYRELAKLQNTYVTALPALVAKQDGRLHTSYNQTITATGRLSSTDPNLQNIPIRTEAGKKIRRAFIAKSGYQLISADYSQIELRLAAAMSTDKKMIQAFKNNEDIHAATAAAINGVKLSAVTDQMRRQAKAINFGILYGQGPFGLSQTADITQWEAKEFIDKYFKNYAGVKTWIDDNIKQARQTEESQTMFGRIRKIPEINSTNLQIRKGAERIAINTPLQGTAADLIKIAMIKVRAKLEKFAGNAKILLQVHDELVVEVKKDIVEKTVRLIKTEMENVIALPVPIVADIEIGDNWEEMKKI